MDSIKKMNTTHHYDIVKETMMNNPKALTKINFNRST
jgi:hypothetical protein